MATATFRVPSTESGVFLDVSITYSVTNTDTTHKMTATKVKYTVVSADRSWYFPGSYKVTYDGTTLHIPPEMILQPGSSKSYSISKSVSTTKTHSAQTKKFRYTLNNSVYAAINVPAKTSYNVTFNANGGSGAPGLQIKWYNETLALTSTKPTRTNHVFKNWNTAANGSGTAYASGANYTANAGATLYAQWYAPYTVAFNANGGTNAPASQTKMYNSNLTLSSTRPTRQNYKFLGWATSASGAVAYQPGGTYTANANVTLYAKWQQVYTSPGLTIQRSYRSNASGVQDDEGTYATVDMAWSTFNANAISGIIVTVNGVQQAATVTTAAGGKSGTAKAIINANLLALNSYAVSATITDAGCTASGVSGSSNRTTKTDSISQSYQTISFRPGGHGCGIGCPATEEDYLRIAHQIRQLNPSGVTILHATNNGNLTIAGTLSQNSDKRLKEHIGYLEEDAIAFINGLMPAVYRKDGNIEVGFYAQDVQDVDVWNTDMVRSNGEYLSLEYTAIIAPLVAYCKQLEKRIAELEEKE